MAARVDTIPPAAAAAGPERGVPAAGPERDVPAAAIDQIRRLCAAAPGLVGLLGELLDRRESRGGLPASATLRAAAAERRALAELLSARAVRSRGDHARIDLRHADAVCREQLGVGLDQLLYAALDRTPRDPAAERAALQAALIRGLDGLRPLARTAASRAWLTGELSACARAAGDTHALAAAEGAAAAVTEAERLLRCLDAAVTNDEPIRIANFAARVLGDSKALAAGSDRARRLGHALLDHHEPTREAVLSTPVSDAQALRFALEVNGIHRDDATLIATCFGPLVYEKAGQTFDHVAAHAAAGDPVPLSLAQLRGARAIDLPVRRTLVIENLTPFLDYVEALAGRGAPVDELVVFSGGQAGWAVVQLLRMVRRAHIPIAHTGDLDRSGVLILRSLETRTFGPIEPVAMDRATFDRFRPCGRPLTDAERARLADQVRRDPASAPCADLLRAIFDAGTWIEQEILFRDAVLPGLSHRRTHR